MTSIVRELADTVELRRELAEHDREFPCQVVELDARTWLGRLLRVPDRNETPCDRPADWLIVLDHACPGLTRHGYLCDPHREVLLPVGFRCMVCGVEQHVTHTERIR